MPTFDQIQHMHPHRFTIALFIWLATAAVTALTIILPAQRLPNRRDRTMRGAIAGSINWVCIALLACWFFLAK